MDTSSTTDTDDLIFLHDEEGNNYLVRRSALKHAQVPSEAKSEILNLVNSETSGYDYKLANELAGFFGVSSGDPYWSKMLTTGKPVSSYDFNGNKVIDWDDISKAKSL